jgi:hypothetical protein
MGTKILAAEGTAVLVGRPLEKGFEFEQRQFEGLETARIELQ